VRLVLWFRNPDIEKSDIGNIPYNVECCYFTGFGRTEMEVVFGGNWRFYKKKVSGMTRKNEISVLSGRSIICGPGTCGIVQKMDLLTQTLEK
jgi:hypothetical protein